jgi:hypothetical protein
MVKTTSRHFLALSKLTGFEEKVVADEECGQ